MVVRVDSHAVIAVFESERWRDAARALRSAIGVGVSVVNLATGATIVAQEPVELCEVLDAGAPMPTVGCIVAGEGAVLDSDSGGTGECELGLRCLSAPVCVDGAVICHVLLTGYVCDERDLAHLRDRIVAAGRDLVNADELLAAVPVLDGERAESLGRLMASFAEALLAEAQTPDTARERAREIKVLSGVTEGLVAGDLSFEHAPENALRSVLRLSGAQGARVFLISDETGQLELLSEAGDCRIAAQASDHMDSILHRVIEADHTTVVSEAADGEGDAVSLLVVPLRRKGIAAGALLVCRRDPDPVCADDLRLVELVGELLSSLLENTREFAETATRLVELIQVNEVGQVLSATLDSDQISELAVGVLSKALEFEVGGFVVDGFGHRHGRLVHLVDVSEGDLRAVLAQATGIDEAGPVSAALHVSSQMCDLLATDEPTAGEWTVLSAPLSFHHERSGSLFVASRAKDRFRSQDERILAALSDHLSIALENAMLYERLAADFDRALAALSALADANERFAPGHTDRVMDHAVAIGEELGLNAERLQLLRFAGLLHDLGKTGVAEEILVKPSALTADEMEHVRRHSELGASIVEQIQILDDLSPIVRSHHEHWDGTGYPDGLMRDEIPLEARILAVADAFEAMTGKRVHRKAMPAASARIELERAAGTQFDPEVVAAFARVLDRRRAAGATGAYAPGIADDTGPRLPA